MVILRPNNAIKVVNKIIINWSRLDLIKDSFDDYNDLIANVPTILMLFLVDAIIVVIIGFVLFNEIYII